jgi:hypothetical protein
VQLGLTPASMVVEYDAGGAVGNRLGGGQEWGLFIDVQPALDLGLGKLPAALRSGLVSSSAAWAPDGTVPRVHAQVELDVGLFSFKAPLDIRLSLLPAAPGQPSARLRADVTWDIEVDAMTIMGIPVAVLLKLAGFPGMAAVLASEGFAEVLELGLDGVAELADKDIEKAFVQAGAQRTGHRSYAFEQALPALAMFGVELRPLSLLASGAGMTLGGVVRVQAVSREPMQLGVNRFGLPFFPTNCRKSGGVRPKVRADQVRYGAGVHFHEMGRFCWARLMPHDPVAAALIEPRLDGTTAATDGFGFHLDLQEASTLHSDVRLLVRTSRGTRVVDLGRPMQAVLDEEGNVTNVAGYLPNCLTYSTEDKHSLIFGDDDDTLLTRDDLVRPMEEPDWALQVQNGWGIEVQLVAVTGLEPGETVVYESPTHRVQVAADRDGRVLLPGFAPLGAHVTPARLQRLGQGPLTRDEVRLVGGMSLQGGGVLRPLTDGDDFADEGGLHRRPDWRMALDAMSVGAVRLAGLRSQPPAPGNQAAINPQPLPPGLDALNPQPLPPEPPQADHPLVRAIGLRDVHAVHAVPGAKPGQLAIAVMKDGRKLVLDGSADRPRVAGTFEGPIGRVVVGDGFAVAPAGGQLRLFEVHA